MVRPTRSGWLSVRPRPEEPASAARHGDSVVVHRECATAVTAFSERFEQTALEGESPAGRPRVLRIPGQFLYALRVLAPLCGRAAAVAVAVAAGAAILYAHPSRCVEPKSN